LAKAAPDDGKNGLAARKPVSLQSLASPTDAGIAAGSRRQLS
jgi:hypothetical protein